MHVPKGLLTDPQEQCGLFSCHRNLYLSFLISNGVHPFTYIFCLLLFLTNKTISSFKHKAAVCLGWSGNEVFLISGVDTEDEEVEISMVLGRKNFHLTVSEGRLSSDGCYTPKNWGTSTSFISEATILNHLSK